MHKLPTSVAVLEHELSELRLIMERQTGVLLDTPTDPLTSLVGECLQSKHLGGAEDLLQLLRSSDTECETLLERLLDSETSFFRYPAALDALAKAVLPEIQARRPAGGPQTIRIWSAGCATGEEAYSIAISVCETVNCNGGSWNVRIVASDIRRRALQFAERGLYSEKALQHVPRHLLQNYFAKVGQHLLIKPRVRNLVSFVPMNLAKADYLGRFDCVFCMDVLPHFSKAQRVALVQRLHLYLEPGGYLFLSPGEKLPASAVTFNPHKILDCTLYQKPLAAAAKYGR